MDHYNQMIRKIHASVWVLPHVAHASFDRDEEDEYGALSSGYMKQWGENPYANRFTTASWRQTRL